MSMLYGECVYNGRSDYADQIWFHIKQQNKERIEQGMLYVYLL